VTIAQKKTSNSGDKKAVKVVEKSWGTVALLGGHAAYIKCDRNYGEA